MPPAIDDIAAQISLTPYQALGIPLALFGAVFLALGAQFQHRGVAKVEASHGSGAKAGLSIRELRALLGRPSWVVGTVMLGLAIVLQLASLRIAPLLVVQPLGAIALVITSIVNARATKTPLDGLAIRAIALCIGGVGVFVAIAAFTATERPIREPQLLIILSVLAVVTVVLGTVFLMKRRSANAIFYILAAGVLYGFVATLAKVVLNRIFTGNFEWLTMLCIVALLAAAALGAYFVQTAYSVGSPDLVIAGLTVVDPIVAVSIGIVVLGEAAQAPLLAMIAFLVAGAVAVIGVFQLAKHHPQTVR
ncbi:DMT family transporter [Diaminobutyricimonas aerilata]|uniref:DMT family transporter n=1 Tax=Diaminobutyricimonas aerilata TaxID=1162967 RepID=UPI000C2369FA|nr:DMT family transporter [Diaminobutyricimonas aerilata]